MAVGDYYRDSAVATTQGTAATVFDPDSGSSKRYIILAATVSGPGSVRVEVGGDTVFTGTTHDVDDDSSHISSQIKGQILYGNEAVRVVNLHSSGNAICTVSLLQVA